MAEEDEKTADEETARRVARRVAGGASPGGASGGGGGGGGGEANTDPTSSPAENEADCCSTNHAAAPPSAGAPGSSSCCAPDAAGAASCCAEPFDHLLEGPCSADVAPSAPPLPPGAGGACASCSSSSAPTAQNHAAPSPEVQFDGVELGNSPFDDIGPLAIYSPPFRMRFVVSRRPFVLVLRHPTDPGRGLRLLEHGDRDALVAAAEAVQAELGLQSSSAVDPQLYAALLGDPQLRASLAADFFRRQAESDLPSGGASSSSSGGASSSSGAVPAATAPPEAATAVPEPGAAEVDDCPICCDRIEPSEAAMRCAGSSGRHHYFHSACMRQWVEACRAGRGRATCPVCRDQIQFHAERLERFLAGQASAGMDAEDRTFLESCAERVRAAGSGWGEVFTLENAKKWGGIAAAGGWGFMMGYTQPPPSIQYQLTLDSLPREHRIAQSFGWVVGVIVRIVREYHKERERERERERSRGRSGPGS